MVAGWLRGPLFPLLYHTWPRASSSWSILGKAVPPGLWSCGLGRGQAGLRNPGFLPPHQGRPCHQERDDPPVSESSFHLQLGTNPIAGSNLILH